MTYAEATVLDKQRAEEIEEKEMHTKLSGRPRGMSPVATAQH